MKNALKLLGIAAFVAVIGFSMIACDNGNGSDNPGDVSNPSGGTEVVGGENGEELEITGAQVFKATENPNGTISYTPYTGNMTLICNGVAVTITGGKLSFSLGVPDNLQTGTIPFYEGIWLYDNVTTSDSTAKGFRLSDFWMGNNRLYKGNYTSSGNNTSGTSTEESVEYVYVDKDVTINGTGKTTDTIDGLLKTENFSFELTKGWNVVYKKEVYSFNQSETKITSTMSLSIPSHLRWIL